jgi:hypothetical protein
MVTLKEGEKEEDATRDFAKKVTKKLAEIADEIKLRLKLKRAARFNELYLLSVAKIGWDLEKGIPTVVILRPEKMILDPDATVDEMGYTGSYIGEYRMMKADALLSILESNGGEQDGIEAVKEIVDKDELGTDISFIEWWEDDKMFWTMGKNVLLKTKNVNWNDDMQTGQVPAASGPVQPQAAENHFAAPKKPYVFLSVFNLGKQPVDETSNTTQNLPNQDRLNKRNRQIDKAIDKMGGGTVVSLANAGLTQDKVKEVTRALHNGGTVAIPSGRPGDAIEQIVGNGLPNDVYEDKNDIRERIKDLFGIRGSTSGSLNQEKTVRGKYLNSEKDGDRVGGSVTEYLEQFSDDIYNWFVQMLYVHGELNAVQGKPKIKVSVKEGSLLPKDNASIAAEARELAAAGLMSKLDLYKRLDDPNPEETAANAWLEVNAPEVLYGNDPRVAQVIQQRAQSATAEKPKPMTITAAFKDLPPDAQAQALAQDGIIVHPEAIAAHNDFKMQQSTQHEITKAKAVQPPPQAVQPQ